MKTAGVLIVVVAVGVAVLYLMFSGPRMRTQPKMMPYQATVPALPQGMVPVSIEAPAVPSIEESRQSRNPWPDTERTRRAGQVYYGYYCLFCHGSTGRGDGPVGRSYTPVPTDLTSPPVQDLSDGALYRAMLTGVGHDPVLPRVVTREAPWYIVSYVRHLQSQSGQSPDGR
ncbi:MAG: hypothetical protein A2Y76_02715 [Planctomycetes bacterium RBG_13_60_9]|nr:MAG: hypothetical protein A2Y76_02715 [Planctomycetes bacterium RBG_13_60_9]